MSEKKTIDELLELSRFLGEEHRNLAILRNFWSAGEKVD